MGGTTDNSRPRGTVTPVAMYNNEIWAFDLSHWGLQSGGRDEEHAISNLKTRAMVHFSNFLERHGEQSVPIGEVAVLERTKTDVDEEALDLERQPASAEELARTLQILDWVRQDLVEFLSSLREEELDWDDPERDPGEGVWWRTPRQIAWHIAICESRYYLGRLGIEPPEPFRSMTQALPAPSTPDLIELLARSAAHVRSVLPTLPTDLCREHADGQVWTTRKVLRRLAWHERTELVVMTKLLAKLRAA